MIKIHKWTNLQWSCFLNIYVGKILSLEASAKTQIESLLKIENNFVTKLCTYLKVSYCAYYVMVFYGLVQWYKSTPFLMQKIMMVPLYQKQTISLCWSDFSCKLYHYKCPEFCLSRSWICSLHVVILKFPLYILKFEGIFTKPME